MARKPRGSGVPKTTGQGISRGIYQQNYRSTGGAIGGGVKKAKVPKGDSGGQDRYAKGPKQESDFNIEYGGMFKADDVKPLGEAMRKPDASLDRKEAKSWNEEGQADKTSAESWRTKRSRKK